LGVKMSNAGCFGRFGACCRLRNASSMTWKHWVVFSGPLGLSHVLCSLNVWHFRVFYHGETINHAVQTATLKQECHPTRLTSNNSQVPASWQQ
jgi:hypothetical protein